MKAFDYLIVGSGLYGSVFAHEAKKRGKKCLVIEKRDHTGGNIFCRTMENIPVHIYGAHIFHTNSKQVWDYVNKLTPFKPFIHSPLAKHGEKLYHLPFNMNTFRELWGVENPEEALEIINDQTAAFAGRVPKNLEEQALSLVGTDIYQKLVKGYSEKQWGKPATELPAFLIKRLPLRFTFDNNYFPDKYQGLPEDGYNKLSEALLSGIETRTNTDFFADREHWQNQAERIVFTGMPDAYFDYRLGKLEYRSLRFEHKILAARNYQAAAVINHTDSGVPYTRTIEHKYFSGTDSDTTVVTWEYPEEFTGNNEPFYPVNDSGNNRLFSHYEKLAAGEKNIIFGGRLGEFRYYDMHQVIAAALTRIQKEFTD